MKRNKVWLVLLVAALLAAAAAAWVWQGQPLTVKLARVRVGPAAELVYATGFVEAQQPVSVQSRITAPVTQVLVNEGDRVVRGQALFVLADEEQRALLAQATAQQRAAALKEGRTVTLYKQGWMTRAARDQAVAEADAARAAQRSALARQDQLVVRALINGIVTRRDVYPGELATPTRVLALLGDPALIRVTATVDERDITRVRVGQPALMSSDAWPGRTIRASVAEVTPTGDPNQRAFRVRLVPDSAADLPLGISLEVNIVTHEERRALLVPASALANGKVWVVVDGRARQRAVTTGIIGADSVQIRSGLGAGDSVIANPPADLADGARVIGTPQ